MRERIASAVKLPAGPAETRDLHKAAEEHAGHAAAQHQHRRTTPDKFNDKSAIQPITSPTTIHLMRNSGFGGRR
jgi:hypothetical protein